MSKIGFDISQTGKNKAGCGYFAYSLIQAIAKIDKENFYTLYKTFGNSFWDNQADKIHCVQQDNFTESPLHSSYEEAKSFWKSEPMSSGSKLQAVDIIHSNNFFCPAQKFIQKKFIFTLHDLSFLEYPEFTTEENRLICFTGVFNASMNADFIVSVSEYSRKHFLKIFPYFPQNKIQTVHEGSRFKKIDVYFMHMPSLKLKGQHSL
jgi:hypothetical protein